MHRARKRSVAAAAFACAIAAGPSAWAFHAGKTFDAPPGAGGGDGIYYAGSPLDRGWKCDLCHTSPEGKISLRITQAELFASGNKYTPGQTYKFDIDLVGEHLGKQATQSNYNSLVVQILDQNQLPVGGVLYAPDEFYSGFAPTTIASANDTNTQIGKTHWSFSWIAPGPMDGPDGGAPGTVTFYLAAVDGNGANVTGEKALTDPFGDDFFSMTVTLEQGKTMMGEAAPPKAPAPAANAPAPQRGHEGGLAAPVLASMVGLAFVGLSRRKRRR
jgi:hypothetical protein